MLKKTRKSLALALALILALSLLLAGCSEYPTSGGAPAAPPAVNTTPAASATPATPATPPAPPVQAKIMKIGGIAQAGQPIDIAMQQMSRKVAERTSGAIGIEM